MTHLRDIQLIEETETGHVNEGIIVSIFLINFFFWHFDSDSREMTERKMRDDMQLGASNQFILGFYPERLEKKQAGSDLVLRSNKC